MSERTLLLGTGELARRIVAENARRPRFGIVGTVGEDAATPTSGVGCPVLGTLPDLHRVIEQTHPDRIIVAMAEQPGTLPVEPLLEAQVGHRIVVEPGIEAYERVAGKVAIEALTPGQLLFANEFRPPRLQLACARAISVLAAGLGLLVLSLPLAAIALAIKLDSPGPVLFVQERIGMAGRRFRMLKFRSMRTDRPPRSEWERDNSDRITHLGRWLRRYRIDELPQLWNVLRGDMNLVGPRPHPRSNFELFVLVARNAPQHGEPIPYYSLRSAIRPGITGWAQVRYKYANGLDEEMEKLRYDLYYIKHYSLWLDLRIVLETLRVVLRGQPEQAAAADDAAMRVGRSALQAAPAAWHPRRLP